MTAEHPSTLASIANLASTFWNQGRWVEAEEAFVQVMETRMRVLGPEHPDTLMTMWNLSHALRDLGRNAEALSLLQACVKLLVQRLGPAHPNTVSATTDLEEWQKLSKHSLVGML